MSPTVTGRVSGTQKVNNESFQFRRDKGPGGRGRRKRRKVGRQDMVTEFSTQDSKFILQQKLAKENGVLQVAVNALGPGTAWKNVP